MNICTTFGTSWNNTTHTCNIPTTYTWQIGTYNPCSVACGPGTQTANVSCMSHTGAIVSDSYCPGTVPTVSQSCNLGACTGNSCVTTLPSCNGSTCTLTYAPTSVNQPWTQNGSSCGYTCTGGYSGVNCSVPPSCANGAIDFPTCLVCGFGQIMQGGNCVPDYHKVSFVTRPITCSEWAAHLGWGPGPNPAGSCDGILDNGRARTIEQGGGYAATYYGGYGGGSPGYGCAYGDVETWCYYSSPSTCGTEYSPGSVGNGLWNFYSNIYSSELTCSLPM